MRIFGRFCNSGKWISERWVFFHCSRNWGVRNNIDRLTTSRRMQNLQVDSWWRWSWQHWCQTQSRADHFWLKYLKTHDFNMSCSKLNISVRERRFGYESYRNGIKRSGWKTNFLTQHWIIWWHQLKVYAARISVEYFNIFMHLSQMNDQTFYAIL